MRLFRIRRHPRDFRWTYAPKRVFRMYSTEKGDEDRPLPSLHSVTELCKRRGFLWHSCELHNGLAGAYDYGPLGDLLKRKLMTRWWHDFVVSRPECYGVDTPIILPSPVWQAAGHLANFHDPSAQCGRCEQWSRADHLLEAANVSCDANTSLGDAIAAHVDELRCAHCGEQGTIAVDSLRQHALMFGTTVGQSNESAYLRPETAQGAFMAFNGVCSTMRPPLPFGIAQMGKAFRNELSTSYFLFRMREFERSLNAQITQRRVVASFRGRHTHR